MKPISAGRTTSGGEVGADSERPCWERRTKLKSRQRRGERMEEEA
jgi:hypothetical protein